VLTVTVTLNNLVFEYFLAPDALVWLGVEDTDLSFLKLVAFIGIIASMVQVLELVIERFSTVLAAVLAGHWPLPCSLQFVSVLIQQRCLLGCAVWGWRLSLQDSYPWHFQLLHRPPDMLTVLLSIVVLVLLLTALAALVVLLNAVLVQRKNVTLSINRGRSLSVISGKKLLDYLLSNDIAIPSACAGAGTCGLCKVVVDSGGGEVLPLERTRLTPAEIDCGTRLSCQLSVKGDLSLTLPNDVLNAKQLKCRIVSSRNVAPLIKEIIIEQVNGEPLIFQPGDFVEVTAPAYKFPMNTIQIDEQFNAAWEKLNLGTMQAHSDASTSRAYSIASRPDDQGRVVLLIRLALPPSQADSTLPPGKVSSWLFSRRANDEVELRGPYGSFHLNSDQQDIVMIGGGVGMAPLRAMSHAFLQSHEHPDIHFFYGARSQEDLFYEEEFDQLAQQHKNFHWTVALSNTAPGSEWSGQTGFIHSVLNEQFLMTHPHPQNCCYYLCGPPLMMQATIALLHDYGVSDERIFADDFGA